MRAKVMDAELANRIGPRDYHRDVNRSAIAVARLRWSFGGCESIWTSGLWWMTDATAAPHWSAADPQTSKVILARNQHKHYTEIHIERWVSQCYNVQPNPTYGEIASETLRSYHPPCPRSCLRSRSRAFPSSFLPFPSAPHPQKGSLSEFYE